MQKKTLEAIAELEKWIATTTKDANAVEVEYQMVRDLREKLRAASDSAWLEFSRKKRAIERYNLEIEKILEYGRRLVKLSRTALPVQVKIPPAVKKTIMNGRAAIESAVIQASDHVDGSGLRVCGIYFLLQDQDIVYIGQSTDVVSRVATHIGDPSKKFNRVSYVPVTQRELDDIESTLIGIFKPRFNSRGVNNFVDENLDLSCSLPSARLA